MVPRNPTTQYTKDREHGRIGTQERRSSHATQRVYTRFQGQDRHRGA